MKDKFDETPTGKDLGFFAISGFINNFIYTIKIQCAEDIFATHDNAFWYIDGSTFWHMVTHGCAGAAHVTNSRARGICELRENQLLCDD